MATYQITVTANITDYYGGNVYTVAFEQEPSDPNEINTFISNYKHVSRGVVQMRNVANNETQIPQSQVTPFRGYIEFVHGNVDDSPTDASYIPYVYSDYFIYVVIENSITLSSSKTTGESYNAYEILPESDVIIGGTTETNFASNVDNVDNFNDLTTIFERNNSGDIPNGNIVEYFVVGFINPNTTVAMANDYVDNHLPGSPNDNNTVISGNLEFGVTTESLSYLVGDLEDPNDIYLVDSINCGVVYIIFRDRGDDIESGETYNQQTIAQPFYEEGNVSNLYVEQLKFNSATGNLEANITAFSGVSPIVGLTYIAVERNNNVINSLNITEQEILDHYSANVDFSRVTKQVHSHFESGMDTVIANIEDPTGARTFVTGVPDPKKEYDIGVLLRTEDNSKTSLKWLLADDIQPELTTGDNTSIVNSDNPKTEFTDMVFYDNLTKVSANIEVFSHDIVDTQYWIIAASGPILTTQDLIDFKNNPANENVFVYPGASNVDAGTTSGIFNLDIGNVIDAYDKANVHSVDQVSSVTLYSLMHLDEVNIDIGQIEPDKNTVTVASIIRPVIGSNVEYQYGQLIVSDMSIVDSTEANVLDRYGVVAVDTDLIPPASYTDTQIYNFLIGAVHEGTSDFGANIDINVNPYDVYEIPGTVSISKVFTDINDPTKFDFVRGDGNYTVILVGANDPAGVAKYTPQYIDVSFLTSQNQQPDVLNSSIVFNETTGNVELTADFYAHYQNSTDFFAVAFTYDVLATFDTNDLAGFNSFIRGKIAYNMLTLSADGSSTGFTFNKIDKVYDIDDHIHAASSANTFFVYAWGYDTVGYSSTNISNIVEHYVPHPYVKNIAVVNDTIEVQDGTVYSYNYNVDKYYVTAFKTGVIFNTDTDLKSFIESNITTGLLHTFGVCTDLSPNIEQGNVENILQGTSVTITEVFTSNNTNDTEAIYANVDYNVYIVAIDTEGHIGKQIKTVTSNLDVYPGLQNLRINNTNNDSISCSVDIHVPGVINSNVYAIAFTYDVLNVEYSGELADFNSFMRTNINATIVKQDLTTDYVNEPFTLSTIVDVDNTQQTFKSGIYNTCYVYAWVKSSNNYTSAISYQTNIVNSDTVYITNTHSNAGNVNYNKFEVEPNAIRILNNNEIDNANITEYAVYLTTTSVTTVDSNDIITAIGSSTNSKAYISSPITLEPYQHPHIVPAFINIQEVFTHNNGETDRIKPDTNYNLVVRVTTDTLGTISYNTQTFNYAKNSVNDDGIKEISTLMTFINPDKNMIVYPSFTAYQTVSNSNVEFVAYTYDVFTDKGSNIVDFTNFVTTNSPSSAIHSVHMGTNSSVNIPSGNIEFVVDRVGNTVGNIEGVNSVFVYVWVQNSTNVSSIVRSDEISYVPNDTVFMVMDATTIDASYNTLSMTGYSIFNNLNTSSNITDVYVYGVKQGVNYQSSHILTKLSTITTGTHRLCTRQSIIIEHHDIHQNDSSTQFNVNDIFVTDTGTVEQVDRYSTNQIDNGYTMVVMAVDNNDTKYFVHGNLNSDTTFAGINELTGSFISVDNHHDTIDISIVNANVENPSSDVIKVVAYTYDVLVDAQSNIEQFVTTIQSSNSSAVKTSTNVTPITIGNIDSAIDINNNIVDIIQLNTVYLYGWVQNNTPPSKKSAVVTSGIIQLGSSSMYPRITEIMPYDETTDRLHVTGTVFSAISNISSCKVTAFRDDFNEFSDLDQLKSNIIGFVNTVDVILSTDEQYAGNIVVDANITHAMTPMDTSEPILHNKAYHVCMLIEGTQSPGGTSVYEIKKVLLTDTENPSVVDASFSQRAGYVSNSSVTYSTGEDISTTFDITVPTGVTVSYYLMAFTTLQSRDNLLAALANSSYASALVTGSRTATETGISKTLSKVVTLDTSVVDASKVNSFYVYILGSDESNQASLENSQFDYDEIVQSAATDLPYVVISNVADPLPNISTVHEASIFSSTDSVDKYYLFTFVTGAPSGETFVNQADLTDTNIQTFFNTRLESQITVSEQITVVNGGDVYYKDIEPDFAQNNVYTLPSPVTLTKAFNSLDNTNGINVTNTSPLYMYTTILYAVDATNSNVGIGTYTTVEHYEYYMVVFDSEDADSLNLNVHMKSAELLDESYEVLHTVRDRSNLQFGDEYLERVVVSSHRGDDVRIFSLIIGTDTNLTYQFFSINPFHSEWAFPRNCLPYGKMDVFPFYLIRKTTTDPVMYLGIQPIAPANHQAFPRNVHVYKYGGTDVPLEWSTATSPGYHETEPEFMRNRGANGEFTYWPAPNTKIYPNSPILSRTLIDTSSNTFVALGTTQKNKIREWGYTHIQSYNVQEYATSLGVIDGVDMGAEYSLTSASTPTRNLPIPLVDEV
jgi:hypothetical protein